MINSKKTLIGGVVIMFIILAWSSFTSAAASADEIGSSSCPTGDVSKLVEFGS